MAHDSPKVIKTDGDIVKIARQIDSFNQRIRTLTFDIMNSDHPNAMEMFRTLDDNGFYNAAQATHCIVDSLLDKRWEAKLLPKDTEEQLDKQAQEHLEIAAQSRLDYDPDSL